MSSALAAMNRPRSLAMHRQYAMVESVRQVGILGDTSQRKAHRARRTPVVARVLTHLSGHHQWAGDRISPTAQQFARPPPSSWSCQTIRSHAHECRSVPCQPRHDLWRLKTMESRLRQRYMSVESLTSLEMTCALFIAAREEPSPHALLPKDRLCLHLCGRGCGKAAFCPPVSRGSDVRHLHEITARPFTGEQVNRPPLGKER